MSKSRGRSSWAPSVGLVLTVASPVLFIVFLALGALTINPCGAFGDGCDEAGTTTGFGRAMFAFALLALFGFVGGVVALVIERGHKRERKRASARGQ
jgi:hypothetical protein